MNELNIAQLEGRKWDEVQRDIIRVVNYYINLWYNRYPTLRLHNVDKEEVEVFVYNYLYLKTKEDNLSNLERHFIEAYKEGKKFRYIINLVKRSTMLAIMCMSRELSKKPIYESLNKPITNNSEIKDLELVDIIPGNIEPIEDIVELKIALESIKHKKYPDYHYFNAFNEKKVLTTKEVLNWFLSGYKSADIRKKIFNKKDKNISAVNLRVIREDLQELVKEVLDK